MALNSTGPISLAGTTAGQSIEIELGGGGSTMISLNDTTVRTLAGVPSGAIVMPTNFYGKSNRVVAGVTISANTSNYTFNKCKVTGYVAGKTCATLTINSGIYVYGTSTGTPALIVPATWTSGDVVKIINNGLIIGMGGNGNSGAGGTALSVAYPISITNNNTVGGGGGGGGQGGSGSARYYGIVGCTFQGGTVFGCGGGGGGGRTGLTNSAGGAGANAGGAGTSAGGGAGGGGTSGTSPPGLYCGTPACASGGSGGVGASWGSTGATGGTGSSSGLCATSSGGAGGGAAGPATSGNVNITWTVVGTRFGPLN